MNQPASTNGTAIASLVFGIIAWIGLPVLGAIVAVICGHVACSEIRRAPYGTVEGNGLALAGLILGYIQLAAGLLVLMLIIGAIALGLSLGSWH
jgi:hypothetical protein